MYVTYYASKYKVSQTETMLQEVMFALSQIYVVHFECEVKER